MARHRMLVAGFLFALFLFDSATSQAQERTPLDGKSEQAKRLEVSRSFAGYRSTLIFYTFPKQKAVLRVLIDNKDTTFPVSATVYSFSDDVSEKGLKKWLNNQHSDALYADAPRPAKTHKLDTMACRKLSHKLIDTTKQRFGEFENYKVEFQIGKVAKVGKHQLKKFKDEATVHVKVSK